MDTTELDNYKVDLDTREGIAALRRRVKKTEAELADLDDATTDSELLTVDGLTEAFFVRMIAEQEETADKQERQKGED